ncbi:MAG: ATP-binding protein [Candidatus Zixiibacteriota bacterium]
MMNRNPKQGEANSSGQNMAEAFLALSHEILLYSNRGLPRIDFVREVLRKLIEFSGCDGVELRLKRRQKYYRCEMIKNAETSFHLEYLPCLHTEDHRMIPCSSEVDGLERLCREVLLRKFDPALSHFTKKGSFWTNDLENPLLPYDLSQSSQWKSLAVFPLVVDQDNIGLLHLRSKRTDFFSKEEIDFYEGLAQTLGVAFVHRSAQVALRERVKELTCLYGIARLVARPDLSLDKMLEGIVELLPPAWLYPEIATARIVLDGHSYSMPDFREGRHIQIADIVVSSKRRGVVEVVYLEEKPELDEGPYLKEERSLIDAVAREVALKIERRQAEEEKAQLQNQLMHADRLATIGQLAAGVAHELNEPLGNILGFAQLATKCPQLPTQALQDIEKIVNASLHAREVVKKLLIFARQMPTKKTEVNLNQIVEEGLYFFESRCAKEGIELVRLLSPNLPGMIADAAQVQQVLVNLVVNSIQAMPKGGRLTIQTLAAGDYVALVVEDTGLGMAQEVQEQIFVPFFTTKEVGEGTGLGLSVVHGIVSSHRGQIEVKSKEGVGTRFEIRLPVSRLSEEEESE